MRINNLQTTKSFLAAEDRRPLTKTLQLSTLLWLQSWYIAVLSYQSSNTECRPSSVVFLWKTQKLLYKNFSAAEGWRPGVLLATPVITAWWHLSHMFVVGNVIRWRTGQRCRINNAAAASCRVCGTRRQYRPNTASSTVWQWTTSQARQDFHLSNPARVFCVLALWLHVWSCRLHPGSYVVLLTLFSWQYISKRSWIERQQRRICGWSSRKL